MINCSGCGANMRFDPESQMLKCDYCGKLENPKERKAQIVNGEDEPEDPGYFTAQGYTCPQCGAELISDDDTAATFCSYCGSSVMLEARTVKMKAPSYVIPFQKTKAECSDNYKKFIQTAFFAPDDFKKDDAVEKFRGIYMPYWVYEMGTEKGTSFLGKKSHRSGDYIITDYFNINSNIKVHSNGTSFDASSAFADELSTAIAPYDFKKSEGFSAGYLSGFYVDSADVEANVYEEQAKNTVAGEVVRRMFKDPTYSRYSVAPDTSVISGGMKIDNEEMAYFPVWFLANEHNGYVSYAVVNGQTGKIAADIPIDYKKYILGTIILAIPIMLVLDLFLSLRPFALTLVTMVFALICYIIANNEMNNLYTREHYLDDMGLRSVRHEATPQAMQGNKKKSKVVINNGLDSIGKSLIWIGMILTWVFIEAEVGGMAVISVLIILAGAALKIVGMMPGKTVTITDSKRYVYKQPFKEKVNVLIKPIIAMGCCALLMLLNNVIYMDLVHYIIIFAVMILDLVSIKDIIDIHNKMTRRMPRQFGRRGGDENE